MTVNYRSVSCSLRGLSGMLPDMFQVTSLAAAIAGMQTVRRFQVGEHALGKVESKPDDTIVTACDRASQRAIFNRIGELEPNAILVGEEKTTYGSPLNIQPDEGQDGWLVDPLDGTSALGQGMPTSTVVVAYRESHRVIGCVIGEPISGRIWSAVADKPCCYHYCNPIDGTIDASLSREAHVWEGRLALRKSTVYYDVSHGWAASNTTGEHLARLFGGLNQITNVIGPGSNALMQALVANGGLGLAGSITTAKGGPWDLCGGRLVASASGYVRGYARTNGRWQECDPLDVDATQSLICANSDETLADLCHVFLETMS